MYMGELVRLVLEKLIGLGLLFRGMDDIHDSALVEEGSFATKHISEILRWGLLFQVPAVSSSF